MDTYCIMGKERIRESLRKNMVLLLVALGMIMLNVVLYTISSYTFRSAVLRGDRSGENLILTLNILTFFIWVSVLILLFVWVIRTRRISAGMGEGMRRDAGYGLIFLSLYAVFFVFYPLLNYRLPLDLRTSNYPLYYYIGVFLAGTFYFMFLMVFILSSRRLFSGVQRYLVVIGCIVLISNFLQWSRLDPGPGSSDPGIVIIKELPEIIGWALILAAYALLYAGLGKRENVMGRFDEMLERSRMKGGVRWFIADASNRKMYIVVLVVVLVLFLHSCLGYALDADEYNSDEWTPIGYINLTKGDEEPGGDHIFNSIEYAREGVDLQYPVYSEAKPELVEISIYWTDEKDSMLWENQPETFSVSVDFPGGSEEKTASNPQGGKGEITISFQPDSPGWMNFTVLLVESGKYTRPVGPGIMEKDDGSNQFDLIIVIRYTGKDRV
ncbi:MAG: hypothetical protein DRN57_01685 [Thermoplasmata archaeon]|nr:MAG: hypothetical protein DRN57_01685 [Thermoplasmata archaeon]